MIWVDTNVQSAMAVERAAMKIRDGARKPFIHWRSSGERLILTIEGLTIKQEQEVVRGRYRAEDLDVWARTIRDIPVGGPTQQSTLRLIEYLRGGE